MTAQELASAFENSKVGQFCKKAADAVCEFYEEHKTAINIIVGVALIAVCAVATVATGGACGFAYAIASNALKGAIWGAVQGAIGGLVNGAVEYYEENGTLDGSGQHLLESTAQGFVEGTFSGTINGVGSGALQFAKSPNSFCFIGGTIALTSKGYKAIEEIRIGDKVLATDPETGDTTEKTVLQTFERQTTEFVDVTIGEETYTTTPEHPFYVEGKDFVNASELEVGDKVVCYDTETDTTETKEVEEVHNYETDEPVTVYNFEVHENHTYHVGEDGVLVHNKCQKAGNTSNSTNNTPIKNNTSTRNNVPSNNTRVITNETKAANAIRYSEATDAWDNYLGGNITNINPRTGLPDANRIFSSDGSRSIRFGQHEMNSIGTPKAHFHYETWNYDAVNDVMHITNTIQRMR